MRDDRIQRGNKKRTNKTVLILIMIIAILFVAVIFLFIKGMNSSDDGSTNSSGSVSGDASADASSEPPDESALRAVEEANQWYLLLVNKDNPLPSDFTADVKDIEAKFARDKGMKYDSRAVGALNEMCNAAEADGVSLLAISSYRSVARQSTLYNNKVQSFLDKGYTEADAKVEAGTIVAVPGTSEHNVGLAVDFNSVETTFENSKQFTWLKNNAAKYGFVLRYPKAKQDITNIIYEPWHYRYVTVEHAQKMNELNMCLEEYIKYLKNGGQTLPD